MRLPIGTYWIAKLGDTPVAGIMEMNGPDFEGVPQAWFAYISVDDVDKRVKKLIDAGGKILRGPLGYRERRTPCVVQDNSGARFGFMTPIGDE